MNSKTIEEAEYAPLHRDSSDEHDESDTSVPITSTRRFPRTHGSRTPCVIAFALILFLFTACAMLSLRIKDLERKLRELKRKDNRVLPTDFKDAVRYLEYEDKVFTGLIASNVTSNGTEVYLDVPAGQPRYFGDPAIYPEIDTNWKDLLGSKLLLSWAAAVVSMYPNWLMLIDEFFSLSDEEAEPFPKENFLNMAAISVFHGLHCINAIRIHMDKDHYLLYGGLHQDGPGYPPNFSRVHMCKFSCWLR